MNIEIQINLDDIEGNSSIKLQTKFMKESESSRYMFLEECYGHSLSNTLSNTHSLIR